MAAEAGFEVKIEVLEQNTLIAKTTKGDYEAAVVIWSGRADSDGNISIWLTCDGFLNWGKYCSKDLDQILADARAKTDLVARLAAIRLPPRYLKDRGHVFLYNHKWLWGLSEKVDGFSTHPDGIIRLQGVTLRQ